MTFFNVGFSLAARHHTLPPPSDLRFSDDAVEKGPQIATRRGGDTAVVVSIDEWRRTQPSERPAATARVHGLTIATRNERDFKALSVQLFNPFRK